MKYKLYLSLVFIFSLINGLNAQEYFQQEVNYKIDVKLNDSNHTLKGFIDMEYTNNSPGQLSEIYFHLWPNAYKNNKTALAKQLVENGETAFYYAPDSIKGYIDSLDFKVNGVSAQLVYDEKNIDVAKVILTKPLNKGDKINISTPFFVKIPKGIFSRLGHIGQSYQITQWYPKPAVFDKNGWHAMPYLNQGEFYSEFGSFDVSITLPKNYVLGATGDLVDGQQELKWLSDKSDSTKKIENFDSKSEFPKSDVEYKTLRYKQSNVHDFAWFADKRWHVLKGEVELPNSKRKVTTWAMFTNTDAEQWKKSLEYLNDAIYYYSLWNGDYPYNQVTAVDGSLSAGGGMEYPNITVIGSTGSDFGLETVIMHEVGHNWFYGILGSNEREHPWMDEGINSFNESRYIKTKYPSAGLFGMPSKNRFTKIFDIQNLRHNSEYELMYYLVARKNLDQPIELPSQDYSYFNYGAIVYSKTAIAFEYLQAYLGPKTFDKAMRKYFDTWKFKHPGPDDLKKIMEEVSLKDLSWFFDQVIKTNKKIDYKIVSLNRADDQIKMLISNKGDLEGPVSISGIKSDTIVNTIWSEGFNGVREISFPIGDYDALKIDAAQNIPEINRSNNTFKTSGVFKTIEPVKFQFLASVENPDKTQIFYSPLIGWNNYNKTMLGMAFYNSILPQKKFEYLLAPMYSFGTKTEAGFASLAYNFYPNNTFQNIRLSTNAQKFAYSNNNFNLQYQKIAPALEIEIKKSDARSSISKLISLRSVNIKNDISLPSYGDDNKFKEYVLGTENYYVNELAISINDKRAINPYNMKGMIEQGKSFVKASLEANYKFSYKKKRKAAEIRVFAGTFISNENADKRFNFSMNGNNDYTYDYYYIGRTDNTGLAGHQFVMKDGGFKNLSTIASSDAWLTSINIKVPVPFKLPLSLYADFGIAGSTKSFYVSENSISSAWNTGIALNIIPNIVEVYFPLAMSSNLNQLKYQDKIRFVFNIQNLNPFKALRNLDIIGS